MTIQVDNLMGKRFLFGVIAIICASIVTIWLKYVGDIYYRLLLTIAGIFTLGQTITDYKEKPKQNGEGVK